jgi:putative transcriptional regulator
MVFPFPDIDRTRLSSRVRKLPTAVRPYELFHPARLTPANGCDMSEIRTTVDETRVETAAGGTAAKAGPQIPEDGPEPVREEEENAKRASRRIRPIPHVKTVRRSLGLTQEEFAARYGIPIGTLRDWEQGRTEPDQPARAYIKVIACNPDWVSRALAAEP